MTRGRGSYGPADRDRHWVIGWGADQAADYVRDQTVGAVLRPALPSIGDAFRASRGAQRAWTAARGIGGRAEAAKTPAQVGQDLVHTLSDRDRAIAQIATGFRALASDLAVWTANNDRGEVSKLAQWIAADVTPTMEEWKAFTAREQKSWWTKIATSWDTFERWWERLKQLRSLARAHGVVLQSVDPLPLPKTIWQLSDAGAGSEATALLGVLKIGALTALGLMGVAGLYGAIRSVSARAQASDDRVALRDIVRAELKRAER